MAIISHDTCFYVIQHKKHSFWWCDEKTNRKSRFIRIEMKILKVETTKSIGNDENKL